MQRDNAILIDITRSIRLIIEFIEGMEWEIFSRDLKTQSAVLHQLMIMGEAVKRLSVDFQNANHDVPWSLIARMRDKLIHGYDLVDLESVWKTAKTDIPMLLVSMEKLMIDRDLR